MAPAGRVDRQTTGEVVVIMSELRRFLLRVWNTLRPGARELDLDRELMSHVAIVEDEHRLRGLSVEAARLAARRDIGSVAFAKELHRDARSFVWVDDLCRDVAYAYRVLRRFPTFSAAALLTLAIGIGANTAIFSAVHAVLLTPLPYPESDRLVRVWENVPGREIGDGKGPDRRYPAMDVRDMLEIGPNVRTISQMANYGQVQ